MITYIALADVQARLTPQVITEIYDDTNTGAISTAALNQDLELACSLTDAGLARVYPGPFPIVQSFPVWTANFTYAADASVVPPSPNGFAYKCGSGGTSGGSTPAFPTTLNSTVTDGALVWTCIPITPQLVRQAALMFFKALAYQRDQERMRTDGDKWMKAAEAFVEKLCEAKAWLTDLLAAPQPGNVGGILYDNGPRMLTDTSTGDDRLGDF